jgi:RNA polymerase sigma-70 factor, ECF subfamily
MPHTADPFRTLYDENHARVRRLLTRLVGAQDAEDLTQTVFANAAKALPAFRGDAEPSTWLYRIAANVASDSLRSRAAHEARHTVPLPAMGNEDMRAAAFGAAGVDPHPSPEQQLSHRDMQACLRGEIAKLTDAYRDVFMLSALGGLSDDEIAQTLGISKACEGEAASGKAGIQGRHCGALRLLPQRAGLRAELARLLRTRHDLRWALTVHPVTFPRAFPSNSAERRFRCRQTACTTCARRGVNEEACDEQVNRCARFDDRTRARRADRRLL